MPIQKFTFKVLLKQEGQRLDHFLYDQTQTIKEFQEPSRSQIRKWILDRQVEVNFRKITLPTRLLSCNEVIHLQVDFLREQSKKKSNQNFTLKDIPVVFEDPYLLVVSKPPGLPTQPTLDPNRQNLFECLKTREGCDYLGLHHRLDVETSGVMVFTKDKSVNAAIGDAFKDRDAKKVYFAVVCSPGILKWNQKKWTIKNFLNPKDKKKGKVVSVKSGGDFAQTDFILIGKKEQMALIACFPKTGRMHQIRVHLSENGLPIFGDRQYNAVTQWTSKSSHSLKADRVLLHAASLTIPHPIHKKDQTFISPLPKDFLPCLDYLSLTEDEVNRVLKTNL